MKCSTYRDTELIKDLTEQLHLLLHLIAALVPEANLVCLLKGHSSGFLEGRHTAVANAGVCTSNVLDQMLRSDQIAHTPASGVEGLTSRAHSEGAFIQLGGQGGNPRKRNIEQAVINFIRKDNQVVLDTEVADTLELFLGEDLAKGVVAIQIVSIIKYMG
jgi:hypothetical protein